MDVMRCIKSYLDKGERNEIISLQDIRRNSLLSKVEILLKSLMYWCIMTETWNECTRKNKLLCENYFD